LIENSKNPELLDIIVSDKQHKLRHVPKDQAHFAHLGINLNPLTAAEQGSLGLTQNSSQAGHLKRLGT
jgi:hypothetical protein